MHIHLNVPTPPLLWFLDDPVTLLHSCMCPVEPLSKYAPFPRLHHPPISPPAIVSSNLSLPSPKQHHRNGIPGSELLERLLVVGVVGIDVASEPASRDGESGALDGLLHEERPLGRAGEGSGARARCAADEGGDRHCVCRLW